MMLTFQFADSGDKCIKVSASGTASRLDSEFYEVYVFGVIVNVERFQDLLGRSSVDINAVCATLSQLDGHFSIALLEKASCNISLFCSRPGGARLYFRLGNERLEISPRLDQFARGAGPRLLDPVALGEAIEYRWLTGTRALIQGVTVVQPGEHVLIEQLTSSNREYFWKFPVREKAAVSLDEQSDKLETLLRESLHASISKEDKVAVLLSGGVDSSVLAAILKNSGKEIVAVSHWSREHGNPELDTAKRFAEQLKIEHRIVEIGDTEIPSLFESTCISIEQPPRAQSLLIINKLMRSLRGEFSQIVYGEAADSLFGSNMVKRFWLRARKKKMLRFRILAPMIGVVGRSSPEVDLIRQLSPLNHYKAEQSLNLRPRVKEMIDAMGDADDPMEERLASLLDLEEPCVNVSALEVNHVIAMNLRGEIATQFHSAGALARENDLQLISPFSDYKVMEFAAGLDEACYFGERFVKPTLRKIGEKYFQPELMYIRKRGFPVPYRQWLETVLQPQWLEAKKRFGIDESRTVEAELQWTLSALAVLSSHWQVDSEQLKALFSQFGSLPDVHL